jgi:intein/homing endonuclease
MSAIPVPSEEECYLIAILDDPSGIELAEFCWIDEENEDGCFRLWDFQWSWYRNEETFQIDYAGRSLGKSVGIQMRAFAFPFNYPGAEMLITAPELNHLRPVTDKVEHQLLTHRLTRELLPKQRGNGINHQPQFQAHFINNARLISRLPQRDGKGVKGSTASLSVQMWDAGTMMTTLRGQVPMEEVTTDDYVLTHRNRYMAVRHIHSYEAEAVEVVGAGHRGLITSTNHRFWARRNANPQRTRKLGPPIWMPVDDPELSRHYWSSPAQFPELELPDLPGEISDAIGLLSLAGSYVADGHLSLADGRPMAIGITDAEADIARIVRLLDALGVKYRRTRAGSKTPQVMLHNAALARWLDEHFGHLANGKKVPPWLLGAPEPAREAFLDGYLKGDGHWSEPKQRWEFGTASKALAIGVKLLAQSLGYNTSYSWVDPKVTHIAGVELKNPPQRSHRVQVSDHGHGIFQDGMLWGKLRSATPVGTRTVYDLVVAEDHSYVADGIVSMGSPFMPDGSEA